MNLRLSKLDSLHNNPPSLPPTCPLPPSPLPPPLPPSLLPLISSPKVHAVMDMPDFERTFSAYQRTNTDSMGSQDTLKRRSKTQLTLSGGDRQKELSLIDGRRAQNLNILLSKYKLSEEKVRNMVLGMDREGKVGKDMVEQLLKYVPTSAEKELLEGHLHEKANFARADQFMLVTSRYLITICLWNL